MEDSKLQFQGFSPPSFVVTYFKDLLEEIRNEAPTWATVKGTVTRTGKHFRGVVEIRSAAGHFFAAARAERPTALGRKLLVRIRRPLNRWKSTRFTHETIRRREWRQRNLLEQSHAGGES
jgi:hypothetical protein